MKFLRGLLLSFAVASVFASGAVAPSQAQSLKDIIDSGKIKIGVNSAAPPFSIIDTSGGVKGYDVDTGNKIAEFLGVEVEFSAYATAARIPALESGKVDIVIATLTPTPARAKQVMFTIPYVTFGSSIIAASDADISSLADLAGKKVGVARGTPQETKLVDEAAEGMAISRFDDDAITMQALIAGQVDAIAVPDTIFAEYGKVNPENPYGYKFPLQSFFMSIAVRKDAFELQQWLNTTISFMKVTGDLAAISTKWVGKPLPDNMPEF